MEIPAPAKERLLYLMRLLERSKGQDALTSAQIEALTGWASHTVRKDISYLAQKTHARHRACSSGECTTACPQEICPIAEITTGGGAALEGVRPPESGRMGSSGGYDPALLASLIKKALGLEKRRKFCVVGLGRLGSAYLNVPDVAGSEFELAAGFDTNVNRTEILKSPAPLYPAYKMAEVIGRFGIEIALLCVPAEAAQATAERLAAAGIRGILNFAPAHITVPPEIAVRNVYLTDELRALTIRMGA